MLLEFLERWFHTRHGIAGAGFSEEEKIGLEQVFNRLLRTMYREGQIKHSSDKKLICQNENGVGKLIWRCKEMVSGDADNANYDLSRDIRSILKNIRPFDIKLLLNRYNESANGYKSIAGKTCIFLLGNTGVGKSTLIHFLKGSRMEKKSGSDHIGPINVTDKHLRKIKCYESQSESVTSYI